jgi:hypothetical protein
MKRIALYLRVSTSKQDTHLFLPEAGVSDLDKAARVVKAEDVFIALLHRFSSQKRHVSDKPTAPNYGPSVFAKEDEAKKYGLKKLDLEQAMRALFKAAKIAIEEYGRPSRPYRNLVVKDR